MYSARKLGVDDDITCVRQQVPTKHPIIRKQALSLPAFSPGHLPSLERPPRFVRDRHRTYQGFSGIACTVRASTSDPQEHTPANTRILVRLGGYPTFLVTLPRTTLRHYYRVLLHSPRCICVFAIFRTTPSSPGTSVTSYHSPGLTSQAATQC